MDPYVVPLVDGVASGLLLFVVAAGLMAAFAVGGVLNLAHGTLFALGAYTAAVAGDGTWVGLSLALIAGTAAAATACSASPPRAPGRVRRRLSIRGLSTCTSSS